MIEKWWQRYNTLPVPVKASLWFVVCAVLQKGIGTITTPIFTRIMTPDEYGQFNVFSSWQSIISVFVTLNLNAGIFAQGVVKFAKNRSEFASSLQGLCLMLCLLWSGIYLLAENFWNQLFGLTTVQMLSMLLMIWLSAVWGFWSMTQRVDFLYRRVVAISLVMSVLTPILGVIMVWNANDRVTARIISILLVQLFLYTGLFFCQMLQGKTFFSAKYWRYALAFNIPLIPHYLSGVVLSSADRIMIQQMVGNDAAGIYSLGCSVAVVMSLFNSSLMQTLEPWLYRKISERRVMDIAPIAYISFSLIGAMNLLLIAFAPELVAIFAPAEYYDAIWIIPPVTMGVYFTFTYSFFATFEFYFEKTVFIAAATVVGAVMNLWMNYLFIPAFGYLAAGYTTLFCYMIFAGSHYAFMQYVCKEKFSGIRIYNLKIILGVTALFMVVGGLFALSYGNVVSRYSMLFLSFILAYYKRQDIKEQVKAIMALKKQAKE